jgi:hypothetical protein
VDCKIMSLDEPDKELGVEEIGELVIKRPQVMPGCGVMALSLYALPYTLHGYHPATTRSHSSSM